MQYCVDSRGIGAKKSAHSSVAVSRQSLKRYAF